MAALTFVIALPSIAALVPVSCAAGKLVSPLPLPVSAACTPVSKLPSRAGNWPVSKALGSVPLPVKLAAVKFVNAEPSPTIFAATLVKLLPSTAGNVAGKRASGIVPVPSSLAFKFVNGLPSPA